MPRVLLLRSSLLIVSLSLLACASAKPAQLENANDAAPLEFIRVDSTATGFVRDSSGETFTPWGFNYDHDENNRLIEDYWDAEWPKIEEDFREMRELGANVVRVHFQFAKFMIDPATPNTAALDRLDQLLDLAERERLYLDITGLGCYKKPDIPPWYDALNEQQRWAAQAVFWSAIAERCAGSPAVFCYDLMNEPVVAAGRRDDGVWVGPPFGDRHFVQYITLDQAGREREAIAVEWIRALTNAIRKHDKRRPITVGLVDWSIDEPGKLYSGFDPLRIGPELDFVSVHIYPESGKVDEAIRTLNRFAVGKPVVIEETFPLRASKGEFREFIRKSARHATGWIGFYWGRTPAESRNALGLPRSIADAMFLGWLEVFSEGPPMASVLIDDTQPSH